MLTDLQDQDRAMALAEESLAIACEVDDTLPSAYERTDGPADDRFQGKASALHVAALIADPFAWKLERATSRPAVAYRQVTVLEEKNAYRRRERRALE